MSLPLIPVDTAAHSTELKPMPARTTLCYKIQFPESFLSLPHAYLILNLPSCHYSTRFPTIFYKFFAYPIWATIKIMLSTVFIVFRGEHKTACTHTQIHKCMCISPHSQACTSAYINCFSHCSEWQWCTIPCIIIISDLKIFTLQMF